MAIIISPTILAKLLEKHGVTEQEVQQCFENRTGSLLYDLREQHRTDPLTEWFIAYTNKAKLLKICFVPERGNQYVRTAFPPDDAALHIYRTKGKPSDF
jgi:uncharacterized DUF497 family protein